MTKTKKTVRESQAQVLERYRGEKSKMEFCAELGISRPTYDAWLSGAEISLKPLSEMAMDHVGEPLGLLAVELIERIDRAFVPCPCQTEVGDNGPCPKHGVRLLRPLVALEGVQVEEVV